jgi:dihydroorotate dehydrogenase
MIVVLVFHVHKHVGGSMLQVIARVAIAFIVVIGATYAILGIFGVYTGEDIKEGLTKGAGVVLIVSAASAAVSFVMRKD